MASLLPVGIRRRRVGPWLSGHVRPEGGGGRRTRPVSPDPPSTKHCPLFFILRERLTSRHYGRFWLIMMLVVPPVVWMLPRRINGRTLSLPTVRCSQLQLSAGSIAPTSIGLSTACTARPASSRTVEWGYSSFVRSSTTPSGGTSLLMAKPICPSTGRRIIGPGTYANDPMPGVQQASGGPAMC